MNNLNNFLDENKDCNLYLVNTFTSIAISLVSLEIKADDIEKTFSDEFSDETVKALANTNHWNRVEFLFWYQWNAQKNYMAIVAAETSILAMAYKNATYKDEATLDTKNVYFFTNPLDIKNISTISNNIKSYFDNSKGVVFLCVQNANKTKEITAVPVHFNRLLKIAHITSDSNADMLDEATSCILDNCIERENYDMYISFTLWYSANRKGEYVGLVDAETEKEAQSLFDLGGGFRFHNNL